MIVQIYEIQTPVDAEEMLHLGVDHIGSVVETPQQCNNPTLKATVETVQRFGRKSSLIPLFSDLDAIMAAIEYYRPDIIHFCEFLPLPSELSGVLSQLVERQAIIRRMFSQIAIMRSIPIGLPSLSGAVPSLAYADIFEPVSDFFLTDTLLTVPETDTFNAASADAFFSVEQPVMGFVGITGRICDWEIARSLVQSSGIPVILAGGIGPDNAAQGIIQVGPAGIDSCTQTNARDGQGRSIRFKKDRHKVRALVDAARQPIFNNQ